MSRLLLLTPELPYPPQQGASLRNFNILRGLAQRHQVHLLAFEAQPTGDERRADSDAAAVLGNLCASVQTVVAPSRPSRQRFKQLLLSRQPDMAWRLKSTLFEKSLARTIADIQFDVVQIEGLELAWTIPTIRQVQPSAKVLFDDHNAEAELQWRTFLTDIRQPGRWHAAAYSFFQARRLVGYERKACLEADAVTVVSEADAEHLRHLAPGHSFTVIPNCIDVAAYAPSAVEVKQQFDLVFTGKMDYRPNVDAALWFVDEIWPAILSSRPETTLAFVGQRPHPRLGHLADMPGVTVTGFVEEIQPYVAGAKVFIMPFRIGSGTRLKLIEAMAAGRAIVSTSVGAEGYAVVDGEHLLLADSPEEFSAAVIRLLDEPELRALLGQAAMAFSRQYDWRQVVPRFEEVYKQILAEPGL